MILPLIKRLNVSGLYPHLLAAPVQTVRIKKDKQGNNSTASYYAANADFITNMNLQFVAGKIFRKATVIQLPILLWLMNRPFLHWGLGTPQ